MNATLYYHLRNDDVVKMQVVAKPGTSDADGPYYEFHVGDVVMFVTDERCRQLMDALGSRAPLPKSDAQIDAESEDTGFAPTMGDTEVFRG